MGTTTRLKNIGVAYKKSFVNKLGIIINRFDWSLCQKAITPKLVATASAQPTGEFLNRGAQLTAVVDVRTAASGTTPTLSVGTQSNPTLLINAQDISSAGMFVSSGGAVLDDRQEIYYTFGSADLTDFDGEFIITFSEANG